MEINGFEIDQYNVYGLDDKKKESTCPECSEGRKKKTDKCLSVYWDTGIGRCNHCGVMLQLHTYKKEEKDVVYVLPKWNETDLSDGAVKWFEGRGISQFTLRRMKITEGMEYMPQAKKEMNAIMFNYFRDGELVNTKYRDGLKNFKLFKGAEKIFYNLDNIKTEKSCVIVEGEIDALSFVEAGIYNVISVPNGFNLQGNINLDYLDNYLEYFDNKDKIYLCMDNDEAGEKGKEEFSRRLGAERCYIVKLDDCKDANEYLIKYGKEKLAEVLSQSKLAPMENIAVLNDVSAQLDDFWLNGLKKGMLSGKNLLDKIFSPDLGQYTLVTGVPQSGKSEFLDELVILYNLNGHGKVGFVSIENEPFVFHYDKIAQKIFGRRPNKNDIGTPELEAVKNHISTNFFHVKFDKRYYLEEVLAKFKELVKRKGCRIFVIDPYNKVRLKKGIDSVTDFTNEYHTQLDTFVKETNCHLFIVAHPNKTEQAEGSRSSFKMPNAYDIKGGGEHFDMSYNVIGVNRIYEQQIVQVKTLKVKFRHLGTAQKSVCYGYNLRNGRYEKLEKQPTHFNYKEVIPVNNYTYDSWLKLNPSEQPELALESDEMEDFDKSSDVTDDLPF
jgi:twinkle protein